MKRIALAALMLTGSSRLAFCAGYDDLNVGMSYFDQGQYDNAITWLNKAVTAGDLIPDLLRIAYLDRGMAYATKGDAQKAIADYSAAIAVKPDDMLAYSQRISAYLTADDLEKALGDYEALRKLRPHDYNILMNTGWLNWQLGHYESSADAFLYFSQTDPYSWLWLQLSNVRLGRPLTEYAETVEARRWPGHLPRFFQGHLSETEVLGAAQDSSDKSASCNAHVFTGLWRLVHGDQTGALPLLQAAVQECAQGSPDWRIAKSELAKTNAGEKPK